MHDKAQEVNERMSQIKLTSVSLVTLAGQAQREQISKPEVTFVETAWESETELVDEPENCSHPQRLVAAKLS